MFGTVLILYRNHPETSMRESLVASKLLYEYAEATGRPLDNSSIYGRSMRLFQKAQVSFQSSQLFSDPDDPLLNVRILLAE